MKVAGKKKAAKKVVVAHHEEPVKSVPLHGIPPIPVFREAFLAQIYDLKRWARKGSASEGMVSSAMPRYAKLAATLTSGERCHFCGVKQVAMEKDSVMNLHPEYPVCECLFKFVPMTHDYVEGWWKPENLKKLADEFLAGKKKADDPVYQSVCRHCNEVVVFSVEKVFGEFQRYGNAQRRNTCVVCYWKRRFDREKREAALKNPLTVPIAEAVAPTAGPEAALTKNAPKKKFNKHKNKIAGAGAPDLPKLPPLTHFEAPPKAPEAPTNG